MSNRLGGCLGIIILLVVIGLIIEIVKWIFVNILGVIGIAGIIGGIVFMVQKHKRSISIPTLIFGVLLALVWFSTKNIMNSLSIFFFLTFIYFLVLTILLGIKRKSSWKKISLLTICLFVLFVVFTANSPDIDTTAKKNTVSSETKVASTESKQTDNKKTSNSKDSEKAKVIPVSSPSTSKSDKKEAKDSSKKSDDSKDQKKQDTASTDKKDEDKKKTKTNKNFVPVTLVKTVDGDTIKVNYKGKEETVRYLLVDTPEEKKPGTCVQPYAVSAYNENKQIVNSGKLSLEFETNGDKRDKYGRLLAYVFVDGKSVQEKLLKDGYARVAYIYNPPYKYLSKYQSDEKIAENKHLNIWSQSGFVTDKGFNGCAAKPKTNTKIASTHTSSSTHHSNASSSGSSNSSHTNAFQNDPSDDQESNLSCKGKIKGNANSKIYHEPGDAYYNRTQDNIVWFCSEAQAEAAGYRHSKR